MNRKIVSSILCGIALAGSLICSGAAALGCGDLSEARADDSPAALTLTPEQAYALFGDNISAHYYDSSQNKYMTRTYDFVGLSSAWIPDTSQGPDHQGMFIAVDSSARNKFSSGLLNPSECLVYKCSSYSWSSNTGDGGNLSYNIQIPFSVSIPSTFRYKQRIYFGLSNTTGYVTDSQLSCCLLLGDNISTKIDAAIIPSPRQYLYGFTPIVDSNDWSQVYDQYRYPIGCFDIDYTNNNTSFSLSQIRPLINDSAAAFNTQTQLWENYLFLECPTLQGYTPPVVTTAPPVSTQLGETVTIPTMQTIDLSNIESGLAAVIQNQYEIGALSGIMAFQLNTIIGQLNAIYAEMVKENIDLPTILHDADPYPTLNTNVISDIDSAFTNYTFASLPSEDIGNGAAGINAFADRLGLYDGVWLAVGLFCVGFSIFCWFLFRGRGGV